MRKLPFLALPLLLGAAPSAAAPDACEAVREGGVHIAPIPIVDIARDPIPIADDMPVAHEVAQIATRGWLLGSELRVPGPERLAYPAGTPLEPDYMGAPGGLCLPKANPPFAPTPPGQRWPHVGQYVQPCLADRDGDGRYEALDIVEGDLAMHVPMRRLARSHSLAAPQVLAEDPLGLARSRRYVHRVVTAAVDGPVAAGKIVRLRITHAFQDQDHYATPGDWVTGPDGAPTYRLTARPPHPVSMTGNGYYAGGRNAEASVVIADGAEFEVGGLAFRIDHYSHGFTLEPQAYRFPPWISYGCGGKSITLGN